MGDFEVILLAKAQKFYEHCPLELAERLNRCFEVLENNPFSGPQIKLLKNIPKRKLYRYRVGDYRVVYEIDKKDRKVGVLLISPRASAYRHI